MMRHIAITGLIVGACVAGSLLLTAASPQGAKEGKKAPVFSAAGTDGKTHTLKDHMAKGTTILYFIKEGCPVNHQAAPHVQKLAAAYGEKANLVGVYNGSVEDAKSWLKRYKSSYPVIADPALKVIRAYGADYSPWMIAVGNDGSIAKICEGASPKELEAMSQLMAKNAGVKAAKLDFTGAPTGGG
jgi:peroxiredoxin